MAVFLLSISCICKTKYQRWKLILHNVCSKHTPYMYCKKWKTLTGKWRDLRMKVTRKLILWPQMHFSIRREWCMWACSNDVVFLCDFRPEFSSFSVRVFPFISCSSCYPHFPLHMTPYMYITFGIVGQCVVCISAQECFSSSCCDMNVWHASAGVQPWHEFVLFSVWTFFMLGGALAVVSVILVFSQ